MKGQAWLWLEEYIRVCQCPDWEPPTAEMPVDAHFHGYSKWLACRSWASELRVASHFFHKVGVVFPAVELIRDYWGKVSNGPPGEWDRYFEPTLGESLEMSIYEISTADACHRTLKALRSLNRKNEKSVSALTSEQLFTVIQGEFDAEDERHEAAERRFAYFGGVRYPDRRR